MSIVQMYKCQLKVSVMIIHHGLICIWRHILCGQKAIGMLFETACTQMHVYVNHQISVTELQTHDDEQSNKERKITRVINLREAQLRWSLRICRCNLIHGQSRLVLDHDKWKVLITDADNQRVGTQVIIDELTILIGSLTK